MIEVLCARKSLLAFVSVACDNVPLPVALCRSCQQLDGLHMRLDALELTQGLLPLPAVSQGSFRVDKLFDPAQLCPATWGDGA